MINWKNEKENLEHLIHDENLSYEEIGRRYGITGAAIKKTAKRLGITLYQRRRINENETFNRKMPLEEYEKTTCETCGKEFIKYKKDLKYCSIKCQNKKTQENIINDWLNGVNDGIVAGYQLSKTIRNYLINKAGNKCEKCGWCETNQYTGKIPLQIHHIDGDCHNNKEDNLQVLCPNCHSLTENFGSRNKNATKGRSDYFGGSKKSLRETSDETNHQNITKFFEDFEAIIGDFESENKTT